MDRFQLERAHLPEELVVMNDEAASPHGVITIGSTALGPAAGGCGDMMTLPRSPWTPGVLHER